MALYIAGCAVRCATPAIYRRRGRGAVVHLPLRPRPPHYAPCIRSFPSLLSDLRWPATTASTGEMAPRVRTKNTLTRSLGPSSMTPALLENMASRGIVSRGLTRALPADQTMAHPEADEVVVFQDFFTAGLHFPLDPVVVDIFGLFKVYLHK